MGNNTSNDTIKQEGMGSDAIAHVLKKKTHHVIPVIASDQIATLLPLVNHTTKHFGFVINSQSEKNPDFIGKQYTLIGRKQSAAILIVLYLSRQKTDWQIKANMTDKKCFRRCS